MRGLMFGGLGLAFILAACSPAPTGDSEKRLAALEQKVTGLKAQNDDLRVKAAAVQSFPRGSPLDDFFASREFWECTYDSAWSDCARRCSKQTSDGAKICAQKPEGERLACFKENTDRGANCLKACPVQSSPTTPPRC